MRVGTRYRLALTLLEREKRMPEHVYKLVELVGSSERGVEDAIQNAIAKAAHSLRNLRWFEVVQVRGQVDQGKVHYYQVTLKAGFTIDDE